jgi:hypothetical protein
MSAEDERYAEAEQALCSRLIRYRMEEGIDHDALWPILLVADDLLIDQRRKRKLLRG